MEEGAKLTAPYSAREILAGSCLAGALVCAMSISLLTPACSACADAVSLAPILGLNVLGACSFAALLAGLLKYRLSGLIPAAIWFVAGIHVTLGVVLAANQILCIPCILCLSLIFVAAISCLSRLRKKAVATCAIAGILICASAFGVHQYQIHNEQVDLTKRTIGFSTWPKESNGPVTLTVFYSDKCKTCRKFKQDVLDPASLRFGKNVAIEFRIEPGPMLIPTTVVGGDEPALFVGKPSWNEFVNAIDLRLAKRDRRNPGI